MVMAEDEVRTFLEPDDELKQPSDAYIADIFGYRGGTRETEDPKLLEIHYRMERTANWLRAHGTPTEISLKTLTDQWRDDLDAAIPMPMLSPDAQAIYERHRLNRIGSDTWTLEGDKAFWGEIEHLVAEKHPLWDEFALALDVEGKRAAQIQRWAWEREHLLPWEWILFNATEPPPDWLLGSLGVGNDTSAASNLVDLPTRPVRKPQTPLLGLFDLGPIAPIPSDKYTRAITSLIRGVSPFKESDIGYPVSTIRRERLDTKLSVRDLSSSTILTQEEKDMYWTVARQLGDYEADLLRISLALYARSNPAHRDSDGYICVPVDVFLDARGLVPISEGNTTWHRSEDKRRVVQALRRLAMLRVEVIDRDNPDAYVRETSVLMMDVLKNPQDMIPVQVEIKPGRWRDETAGIIRTPQFAPTNQWVYKFDPVRERWEKRLSEYISDFAHIDKKTVLRRGVGELLEATGLWDFHDVRNPGETRKRYKQAMDTIVRHGIIESWNYAEESKAVDLPKYKWIDKWRLLKVDIVIASKVAESNLRTAERARQLAANPKPARKPGRPRKTSSAEQRP